MPTPSEFVELTSKCSWEWSEMNGVNGTKVTGQNGNSIFLPAGVNRMGETISNQVGQRGCYWSGSLWSNNVDLASYFTFTPIQTMFNRQEAIDVISECLFGQYPMRDEKLLISEMFDMKTRTFLLVVIAFSITCLQAMTQNNDKRILVACFSATGTTAQAAATTVLRN